MSDNKDAVMAANFLNGLEGQLRNTARTYRMLWVANGGDESVLLPIDETTVKANETGVVVTVVSPIGNTSQTKQPSIEKSKKALSKASKPSDDDHTDALD